ncbi:MAG: hypothetical protein ACLPJJ_12075 [Acidocella sp.]|uniref:hypothetical protein n=1 Tax=Acidocella sp. TaxID=50710 RepID=UPI003FD82EF2
MVPHATSVIRFAKPGSKSASAWLLQLLERKPRKLAAVALANKMARIIWASGHVAASKAVHMTAFESRPDPASTT